MSRENPKTANLIKGNGQKSASAGQKVVKNQIISAQKEAARILEEAEMQAAEIRREAQTEAEGLKAQASREGTEKALTEFESNLMQAREIREKVWRETEKD